ncbi:MAG TPA: CBS domain-containing protein [Aliidongia sp.]|nr:CBS domain-containing protein [Aliidongia sp.]
MGRKIVPDLVQNQVLTILSPSLSVRDAAKAMAERNIGAVLVAEVGRLRGICTERDIAHRVVAKRRDPDLTTIADIMTTDPAVVSPNETPAMALEIMRRIGCRHLPVMDGERIVGMLSIRDLYAAIQQDLEEDLRQRDDFIMGSGYSVAG